MLSYIDVGEGTPIVLIHGLGQRKESWAPQMALAKRHRLIIPDLRGHGQTELDKDITLKNFAKDIIELLEELDVPEAYICGLSLGGIVAQELYSQKPSLVKGLILSNTSSYISSMLAYNVILTAIKHYRDEDFIETIVERGLHNKSYKAQAKGAFMIRESYISAMSSSLDINYFPVLMGMKKPLLLMGSMYDNVTPIINHHTMCLANWNAETKIFQKAGHLSNIECSEEFNQTIDNFVRRNEKYGNKKS